MANQQKKSSTEQLQHWWQQPAIIVPVIVAIIGLCGIILAAIIPFFFKTNTPDTPPPVVMRIDDGNVDRTGSDLYPVAVIVDNFADCSDRCLKDDMCKAVSYRISSKQCWMKNAVPPPNVNFDFESAVKSRS